MNEDDFFYEIYDNLTQTGPGSDDATRRALGLMGDLPQHPTIIDFGCGPGRASIVLARETSGHVTAIDIHPPFIDALAERVHRLGLSDRLTPVIGDMADPPLKPAIADLIWSEGAVYFLGFEHGLQRWRDYLKPTGYVAVSELTWTTASPSETALRYWKDLYPGIQSEASNIKALERAGYTLVDTFTLSKEDWSANFYQPLQQRIDSLRATYPHHSLAHKVADREQAEIDLWQVHGDEYGYVFYIGRKYD